MGTACSANGFKGAVKDQKSGSQEYMVSNDDKRREGEQAVLLRHVKGGCAIREKINVAQRLMCQTVIERQRCENQIFTFSRV